MLNKKKKSDSLLPTKHLDRRHNKIDKDRYILYCSSVTQIKHV